MQFRMQAHTRRAVTRQYLSLPMEWHQRHPTGQLLSNAYSDVEAAWGPIAPLPMALGTVVMMAIAVVQMLFADVVLAMVGLLVFPAVVVANLAYQRLASPLMTRAQGLRAEVSEIAHESFDGAMVVKTLGREGEETERFRARAHELRDVNTRAGAIRAAFDPTLASLPNIGVLVVLAVGTSAGARRPDRRRRRGHHRLPADHRLLPDPRDRLAARRVPALGRRLPAHPLGAPRHRRDGARRGDPARCVRPRRPGRGRRPPLLVRRRRPRCSTASRSSSSPAARSPWSGRPPPGKSTLTSLLTRLVDPDSGRILIDGADLRDLRKGALAESVSLVPQTAFLFDDTVRDNVTLGADVSDEEVWAALRAAQADGFVAALGHGLDTQLGERGTSLSGGQRQRISLARALVRRPRLLILDDATSAVDPEVEARILQALRTGGTGATLVVVAYRKATIALADEVRPPRGRPDRRPGHPRRAARAQPVLRPPGQRLRAGRPRRRTEVEVR